MENVHPMAGRRASNSWRPVSIASESVANWAYEMKSKYRGSARLPCSRHVAHHGMDLQTTLCQDCAAEWQVPSVQQGPPGGQPTRTQGWGLSFHIPAAHHQHTPPHARLCRGCIHHAERELLSDAPAGSGAQSTP